MDDSSTDGPDHERSDQLRGRGGRDAACPDAADHRANENLAGELRSESNPESTDEGVTADDPAVMAKFDQEGGDQIAARLAEGTLFGSALHRYARLMQIGTKTRCSLVERLRDEFRELCPEGVSPIEVEAAERVVVAKMKTLVFDNLMADPRNWDDPSDRIQKMQTNASRELDRAMRLLMALRKAATAQPGFRVVASQTEQRDGRTRTRSVSYEQLPDDTSAMLGTAP